MSIERTEQWQERHKKVSAFGSTSKSFMSAMALATWIVVSIRRAFAAIHILPFDSLTDPTLWV
jgi:hypothetical protein